MKLVIYPDKRLTQKSKPVSRIDAFILSYHIKPMIKLMREKRAVGLAGVQVGILRRFFIMQNCHGEIEVIYNPKILEKSKRLIYTDEECLSLPDRTRSIRRSNTIHVSYQNENLENVIGKFVGIDAVIFQHEYDHLDGKLIIDK